VTNGEDQNRNVVDHLDTEMRSALEAAVKEAVPDAGNFDRYTLFRAFRRAVGRKCNTWGSIPNSYVDMG
jgi:hypothetical protein